MRITCLALSLIAGLAAPAAAQEAFIWTYDAVFPILPGEAQLNIIATSPAGSVDEGNDDGLPGGIIWGRCLAAPGAGEVALRFEAFAGAARAGDSVSLTLSGGGMSFTGPATIMNRELKPTGGPELIVPIDSPALAILRDADLVSYGVDGLADFFLEFDLSANRAYVAEFIDQCAAVTPGGRLHGAAPPEMAPPQSGSLSPDFGPAITGHVWGRVTEISPDPSRTVLTLFYAVPETDDALVVGECVMGPGGPTVVLTAAAHIDGLAEGAATRMRFTADTGQSATVPGTVVGVDADVGVSGVEMALATSDPAWLVIAGSRTLSVERVGARGFTLTGNGPNTIGGFLSDCSDIARLRPEFPAPSPPIGAQPGALSCDMQGRVSSRDTGQPQVINFINDSGAYRGLLWIDPTGTIVDVTGLNAGEAAAFSTDPGHVWMATDGPGDCVEMMRPEPGQAEYRLTVPN